MDVLKPDLVWIEGRCYRVNDAPPDTSVLQEYDLYGDEMDVTELEPEDDNFDITVTDSGRYSTSFHVSKHYLGSLIGAKGATKRRIESDTRTEIRIPRQGQSGDVVVLGNSSASVSAARRRINVIVMAARQKQRPTHFLSIPLNSPDIVENYNRFKDEILNEVSARGLEDSIFIGAQKLHLTMGVMCLMDNEERLQASQVLAEAKTKIVDPLLKGNPLQIVLEGINYMNDDPHAINVLYGKVKDKAGTEILQKLADELADYFYQAGLAKKERGGRVYLHATIINTIHRKDESEPDDENDRSKKWTPRQTFDGSEILKKYENFRFGEQTVTEIHLSQMQAEGPDGYYQPTSIISV